MFLVLPKIDNSRMKLVEWMFTKNDPCISFENVSQIVERNQVDIVETLSGGESGGFCGILNLTSPSKPRCLK